MNLNDQNKVFLLKNILRNWETINPVVFKPLLICCCFCTGLDDIECHSAHLKNPLSYNNFEAFND